MLFYQIQDRMSRKKWEKQKVMEKYLPLRRVWFCVWTAPKFFCRKSNKKAYVTPVAVFRLSYPSELLKAIIFVWLIYFNRSSQSLRFFCAGLVRTISLLKLPSPAWRRLIKLFSALSIFKAFYVYSSKHSFSVPLIYSPILTNVKYL